MEKKKYLVDNVSFTEASTFKTGFSDPVRCTTISWSVIKI